MVGDRIHSRYFGLGTIQRVTYRHGVSKLVIDFDDEGRKTLCLTESVSRRLTELVRYFLLRIRGQA
ncbi:MAG: hypothetical protein R3C05_14100 [Pirellulaceae bacterium]